MANLMNGDPNLDGYINKKDAVIEVTHLLTGDTAVFRAFVTQFTDDFQSTWAETQVYGRMDDLATFQRTKRMITVEIDVPSYSDEDAVINYLEGIKLKKFLYPGYEHTAQSPNAAAISSSPLVRVKFMNFVVDASNLDRGLLGFLKGLQTLALTQIVLLVNMNQIQIHQLNSMYLVHLLNKGQRIY